MADEEDDVADDSSSSDDEEEDIIEELHGWMILDQSSSSSEDEGNARERVDFDKSLPITHSYLGDEMEELHGRTIHCADEIIRMPLLLLPDVTLVPGQILPLHIFNPQSVSMMQKVLQADRTFGLLNLRRDRTNLSRPQPATIGTTAEIFSAKEEIEFGISTMRIKAEGRQRFRVLESKRQLDGVIMGKVKILNDSNLPVIPNDTLVCNCKRKPNFASSKMAQEQWTAASSKWKNGARRWQEFFPKTNVKTARTSISAFPYWVYHQYNPYYMMDLLMNEIRNWNKNLEVKNLPIDPNEFSQWLTANLPLDDILRHTLLEIDCSTIRLRRQLEIIRKYSGLYCAECGNSITNKKELFSLSVKGPLAAYVNPGGYVHETVTFYKATGLRLRGSASEENSWFPGYAWTIAECSSCSMHMGWRFTACTKGLTPSKFWGLARASLKQQLIS
eukprot:gene7566-8404_t